MKIAAIIPSRYESTRFKGKPLALIAGKTMIERVYCRAAQCEKFCEVIVATDDKRIADVVEAFGGHFVFTSPDHQSGTDRIWEVLQDHNFDAVINIQGDEPTIPVDLVCHVFDQLATGKFPVVTPVYFNTSYTDFLSRNVVKAVAGENLNALYFSRSPVPYSDENDFQGFYHHIGLYGYLKSALQKFVSLSQGKLEKKERLEQLRFLENNIPVKLVESQYRSFGVDVPDDIERIEKILSEENV